MPAEADGESGLAPYPDRVKRVLQTLLGKGGAQTILYYTGEPDPSSFEEKLRKVLGGGAERIMQEVRVASEPAEN